MMIAAAGAPLAAQTAGSGIEARSEGPGWLRASLTLPTGEGADRLRLAQGAGEGSPLTWLLRSTSSVSRACAGGNREVAVIAPELRSITNSALPSSRNDGPLWAGKGANLLLTGGACAAWGPVRLIIAPQYASSTNRAFQVFPFPQEGDNPRNVWANPFHPLPMSVDAPIRFGDQRLAAVDPGQSSLAVTAGGVQFGAATESRWWGPGAMNAIVLSDNAAGFPHLFARSRDGWSTRFGRFHAEWVLGSLRESDFFDADSTNDTRSLSAAALVWSPRGDSALSVGVARAVISAAERGSLPVGDAFNFLSDAGRPAFDTADASRGIDQVTSLFARWMIPSAGLDAYAEWARLELPVSLRDFLEFPQHSQAYTLGLNWSRPVTLWGRPARLRILAEGTYLEPDPAQRVRPVATTYTSASVPQGFTHRGQPVGAGIGPGSSSQSFAVDFFGERFMVGFFADRVRWDNATVWTAIVPEPKAEDTSLIGGVRGSVLWRGVRWRLDYAREARLDFLFQDRVPNPDGLHTGVDFLNNTLSLTLSAPLGR